VLSRLGKKIQHLRNRLSRSEWLAKKLRQKADDKQAEDEHRPGILLIQIDGLGHDMLLRGFEKKRLPFLQRLIQQDNFVLRPLYSGLPSATPAVQAELFYGIKGAVPAFQYYDRHDQKEKAMYDAEAVDELAAQFEHGRRGLLRGGSSYSNIYDGGAKEAFYCIQTMKLSSVFDGISLRNTLLLLLVYLNRIIHIAGLSLLETGLAVVDFVKGIFRGNNACKEFTFIFLRIGVCIVLRELVRLRVKIDIARGLPVIHTNFIGYDEHAHRRSPTSAFAFWSLKGIDGIIKDIVKKAVRSKRRDYHIFIYSDHGQESAVPFAVQYKRSLKEAVADVFSRGVLGEYDIAGEDNATTSLQLYRRSAALLRYGALKKLLPATPERDSKSIHITAMGPLGHIYLPLRPGSEEMACYGRDLVEKAGIPLVLYVDGGRVKCITPGKTGEIGEMKEEIFGGGHPFLDAVKEDMERLCRHDNAGDFIISGWKPKGDPLTFPLEKGSHGGPGIHETKGFAILPDTLGLISEPCTRPEQIRDEILAILNSASLKRIHDSRKNVHLGNTIKVMTYNIHSCIGIDGKLFVSRIGRIIGRQAPDIVALQEVDRNMRRTGRTDQIRLLADQLDMYSYFFPLLSRDEGAYGLAVLSRSPFTSTDITILPRLQSGRRIRERRGIMRVQLDTPAGPLHFLNTHLSFIRQETLLQVSYIAEQNIRGKIPPDQPIILCGDLNSGVKSNAYAVLSGILNDCEMRTPHFTPEPTFFSAYPLLRLDHIFHSGHFQPLAVHVINDWECRLASDHLPVCSTLLLKKDQRTPFSR